MVRRYAVVLALLVLAGCDFEKPKVDGSGIIKTESRTVGKFTAIQLTGGAELKIEQTGAESLTVTGDDNLLPIFKSEVKGDTLYLSVTEDKRPSKTPVYTITVADLRTIDIRGGGLITATKLAGEALSMTVEGAAKGSLAGQIVDLTISMSGAGALDAAELKAKRGKVSLSGAGVLTVNVSDELDASVSGVGIIWYIGDPKLKSEVSGLGAIKKK
jgi:hypothetical protein